MMPISFYIDLLKDRIIRRRYACHSSTSGQGSAILMFHHVAETPPEGVSVSCYSSISDFRSLLTKLGDLKQFISLSDLCKELQKNFVPKDKIVITFDDVPSNVYYNAVPILREFGIPYVLYISTKLMEMDGFLSKKQLFELSKDPLCTIGSHTVSHCMLKRRGVTVLQELSDSQKVLEEIINKPVEHFAYPYGTPFAISERIVHLVERSGIYRSAVCTIPAYINEYSKGHIFSLPRIHSQLFTNEYLNKQL